jgi:hypothetical protein
VASEPVVDGRPWLIDAFITNTGTATWLPSDSSHAGVLLGAHVYDSSGKLLFFDAARQSLGDASCRIAPGESVQARIALPSLPAGRYRIELDCVAEGVTWFAQVGSQPAMLRVDVHALTT